MRFDKFFHIAPILLISVTFFSIFGCGSNSASPEPEPGAIVLNPNPDIIDAPWTVTNQERFSMSGNGDSTLTGLDAGEYTVTWGAVAGWTTPAGETESLDANETLTFSCTYVERCTIQIDPNPRAINAPWTLTSMGDFHLSGCGDHTEADLEPGEYTVVWGDVEGWISPLDETGTMDFGESLVFEGNYLRSGFVQISAGNFWMGAKEGEKGAQDDEYPRHQVTLTHGFALQATEVTNQQYADMAQWAFDHDPPLVTATSISLLDALDGSTQELLDIGYGSGCEIAFSGGVFTVDEGKEDHPVKEVTWYGSVAYCDWLSLQEGLPRAYDHTTWQCNGDNPYAATGYRLPTEAEWEYACRAGSSTAFANGPITYVDCSPLDPVLDKIGWYCGNVNRWTHAVGQKSPNAWGLYDLHGNLYEWCNDWYSSNYYSDPGSGFDPVGGPPGSCRVTRGGFWYFHSEECRSAYRLGLVPEDASGGSGFRPAKSAN